jgi:hypothetical protein
MGDWLEELTLGHHPERLLGRTRSEQLVELLDQPRGSTTGDFSAAADDSGVERRVDDEAKSRRHGNCAEHSHGVLVETLCRVAD